MGAERGTAGARRQPGIFSNSRLMAFLGALPARFRRERVLIVGCGDVGQRAARVLGSGSRVRLLALTSSPDNAARLRAQGISPLRGDLDRAVSLQRLAGLLKVEVVGV